MEKVLCSLLPIQIPTLVFIICPLSLFKKTTLSWNLVCTINIVVGWDAMHFSLVADYEEDEFVGDECGDTSTAKAYDWLEADDPALFSDEFSEPEFDCH